MGGGGGFIGGGSPDGRGRWFANVNYSYEIANEVLVAEGGPLLDLLDGDALSGSLPRHSGNFNLGLFYRGFGMNLNARYVGSSRINGSGLPGSADLIFDDIATFNLRFFADLGQRKDLVEKVPLLANTRVTLGANNLFDARQRIVDDTGAVPLRYQPYLVDPVGRFLTLEIRKLF
jgi:outer membrane receptor protein involved in Fe transport